MIRSRPISVGVGHLVSCKPAQSPDEGVDVGMKVDNESPSKHGYNHTGMLQAMTAAVGRGLGKQAGGRGRQGPSF